MLNERASSILNVSDIYTIVNHKHDFVCDHMIKFQLVKCNVFYSPDMYVIKCMVFFNHLLFLFRSTAALFIRLGRYVRLPINNSYQHAMFYGQLDAGHRIWGGQ